jgi:hypothetical protein
MADWFTDPANFPDGAFVYAANVYEPSDGTGQSDCFFGFNYADRLSTLDQMNEDIIDLAAEHELAIVDIRGHFSGHGYNAEDESVFGYDADDTTLWLANDCIHPNDVGHHEMRRLFHSAIVGQTLTL